MELPVIDLAPYLELREAGREGCLEASSFHTLCKRVADCLKEAGALVVRDPRCSSEDNDRFLDMMETYFGQPDDVKKQQARPELHYQVGVTPEGVELPRSAVDASVSSDIDRLSEGNRPRLPVGPDPKWRYMWRVGPRPQKTRFQELNAAPVIPNGFPEWTDVMNTWGRKMIAAVEVVAEMAAIGFGLPPDAITNLMHLGPHLLAPTGSDLSRYGKGTVFAGYHYDLNALTIHGKSRFPGLFIWLRNGTRVAVKVPDGCLLLQAGKQLEWLTGGECRAGMHEVAASEQTAEAVERARREGRSLWRVSSTVFGHIASDAVLQPLGHFAQSPTAHLYPPTPAGEFVEAELAAINLKRQRVQVQPGTTDQAAVIIDSDS